MTSEVVAEIEAQAKRVACERAVPPGLEDELDTCFEEVAEVSSGGAMIAGGTRLRARQRPTIGGARAAMVWHSSVSRRRRSLGERLRAVASPHRAPGSARSSRARAKPCRFGCTSLSDHLERLARTFAGRRLVCLCGGPARGFELVGRATMHPTIEGPLLAWVLERPGRRGYPSGGRGAPARSAACRVW